MFNDPDNPKAAAPKSPRARLLHAAQLLADRMRRDLHADHHTSYHDTLVDGAVLAAQQLKALRDNPRLILAEDPGLIRLHARVAKDFDRHIDRLNGNEPAPARSRRPAQPAESESSPRPRIQSESTAGTAAALRELNASLGLDDDRPAPGMRESNAHERPFRECSHDGSDGSDATGRPGDRPPSDGLSPPDRVPDVPDLGATGRPCDQCSSDEDRAPNPRSLDPDDESSIANGFPEQPIIDIESEWADLDSPGAAERLLAESIEALAIEIECADERTRDGFIADLLDSPGFAPILAPLTARLSRGPLAATLKLPGATRASPAA